MPVQVDTPINTGTLSQWGLWGSAPSKVAAVATNDGDTSIVYASSGGRLVQDDYIFSEILGVTDPVNSASLTAISRRYLKGVGGRSYWIRWNRTQVGTNRQAEVGEASYVTITYNAAGGTLALAAVNGQHGMEFSAAGGPSQKAEYWVTHLYRTVDFTYSAGSADAFAYNLGSLAALIGGNLLLQHMPGISGLLGRIRLRPDEYEPALRAWNAQKHMVMA